MVLFFKSNWTLHSHNFFCVRKYDTAANYIAYFSKKHQFFLNGSPVETQIVFSKPHASGWVFLLTAGLDIWECISGICIVNIHGALLTKAWQHFFSVSPHSAGDILFAIYVICPFTTVNIWENNYAVEFVFHSESFQKDSNSHYFLLILFQRLLNHHSGGSLVSISCLSVWQWCCNDGKWPDC